MRGGMLCKCPAVPQLSGARKCVLSYAGLTPEVPRASVPPRSQQGHNSRGSAFPHIHDFLSNPSLSPPAAGHGQPKGFCDGYCAHACGETDEWSFSAYCEELHCCIPSPKKGK